MRPTRVTVPRFTSGRVFVRRQRLRFALGMLQMFGVVFTLVVIIESGINTLALTATVLTCAATTLSVLLFGRRE